MAATDARPVPRKNAAFRFYFAIRKNDGTLITTWAGQDSEVSLDGAAFADCTNEATEIGTSGCGYIDLTAAEMNADSVVLKVTVTNTDALPLVFTLFPEEAGDYRSDVTHFGGTAGTFASGRPEVNTTHAAGTAWNSGAITSSTLASGTITAASIASSAISSAKFASGAITATVIADGAIDAATFAADVDAEFLSYIVDDATRIDASSLNTATVTSIPAILDDTGTSGVVVAAGSKTGYTLTATTGLGNQTANITGTITTATNVTTVNGLAAGVITAASIATGAIDADSLATDAVAEIADGVWDEALSGHSTAGTAGLALSTASSGGVDPSVLADAIWDEDLSGHATSGTAGAVLSAVNTKTTNLPSDPADQSAVEAAITAATTGLSTLTTADVNAQVLDVLNVDTFAELSAVPTATPTLRQMIQFAFMWFRNKSTQTSSQRRLFADDGSTAVATETVSDDGTTYTKGEAS